MARYELTQQAETQLLEILAYSLVSFGDRQAEKYYAELFDCFQRLADNPGLGPKAERAGSGRRRYTHGPHVIIYRQDQAGVRIIAVFHMSTNWRLPETEE